MKPGIIAFLLGGYLVGANVFAQPEPAYKAMGPAKIWTSEGWKTVDEGSSSSSSSGSRSYSGPSAADIRRQEKAAAHARAVALNDKGVAAWDRREWGAAAELFRQASREDPESQTILRNLINAQRNVGLAAMEKGEWDNAANSFQSLLLYRPGDQEFKDLQAQARKKQQEAEEARKINESGRAAGGQGDLEAAENFFKRAIQLNPFEPVYRRNLGIIREMQGTEAWSKGDHEQAMTLWESALEADSSNATARTGLVAYGPTIMAERAAAAAARETKAVVTNMQQGMTQVADSVKAAKPGGGLSLDDFSPDGGPFGTPVVRVQVTPAPPARAGPGLKAGDQLLAGQALAAAGGDLAQLYDVGGAPHAGSLAMPTAASRPELAVLAAYAEKARNDPEMITLARDFATMQAKRSTLEQEYGQLVHQRNLTADKAKFQELSGLVEEKKVAYQTSLQQVFDQTERLKAREHRMIDAEVGPAPSVVPAPAVPGAK